MALVLIVATLGSVGVAAANHPDQDCSQLDHPLEVINETADDNAEENNQVERAKDECEGDHHQDEANAGGENADDNRQD